MRAQLMDAFIAIFADEIMYEKSMCYGTFDMNV